MVNFLGCMAFFNLAESGRHEPESTCTCTTPSPNHHNYNACDHTCIVSQHTYKAGGDTYRRVELVLLHGPDAEPQGTAAWLDARPHLARHHHIRLTHPKVKPPPFPPVPFAPSLVCCAMLRHVAGSKTAWLGAQPHLARHHHIRPTHPKVPPPPPSFPLSPPPPPPLFAVQCSDM